jgi:hypothetical protein
MMSRDHRGAYLDLLKRAVQNYLYLGGTLAQSDYYGQGSCRVLAFFSGQIIPAHSVGATGIWLDLS